MHSQSNKHGVYSIDDSDPRALVLHHKGVVESFFTGSVLYFGDGADLDYVLLVDVFKTTGHRLMSLLFDTCEACGDEEYMDGHIDRRAFRTLYKINGKTVNYIVTADKSFYDAMMDATMQVLVAEANGDTKYRDKLTRVNLFRSVRGESPISRDRFEADALRARQEQERRSLATITSGPSYY